MEYQISDVESQGCALYSYFRYETAKYLLPPTVYSLYSFIQFHSDVFLLLKTEKERSQSFVLFRIVQPFCAHTISIHKTETNDSLWL